MADSFYVIDGHANCYRAYYATQRSRLAAPDGFPTGAIQVFLSMLQRLVREHKPQYLAIVFDVPGKTFRHERFAAYKATRKPMPDDLREQIPVIQDICRGYRIPVVDLRGYEADDLLGTLGNKAADAGLQTVLVTSDKDALQLVADGRIAVYDPVKDVHYDEARVTEVKGVEPSRLVDLMGLMGDSSDNIPGVPGVGPKKALSLLNKYGTLEKVLASASQQTPALRKNLFENRDQALMSRELATIKTDVPVPFEKKHYQRARPDTEKLVPLLQRLGLAQQLRDLTAAAGPAAQAAPAADVQRKYHTVSDERQLARFLEKLAAAKRFAFDLETTARDPIGAELVGYSFSWAPGEAWYLPVRTAGEPCLDPAGTLEALRPILEDPAVRKVGQNIKYDMLALRWAGVSLRGVEFDTMVAAYLVAPGQRQYGIDALALQYLGRRKIATREIIGTGKKQVRMDQVLLDQVARYACEDAEVTWALAEKLAPKLDEMDLAELFHALEMPLVEVLAEMEWNGVTIDREMLAGMSKNLRDLLAHSEAEIYRQLGREFNINSSRQLAEILFTELGLPVKKRTKTGPSTDQEVLEALSRQHPLPALVLEYRQLAKLKSTYVDALPELVNPRTGRIHASFNQTVAATGRLSSADPNLQNIPVRTDLGRGIRACFVPREADWRLLACDYSQIELRLVAHYSQDEALRAAFAEGRDIHAAVAAVLNGVDEDAVDGQMRRRAKAVNFGIIYGQTAFGLARETGMSRAEAQQFIDAYFAQFPGVKRCIDRIQEEARERQYVSTILGRRRFLPEINSDNRTAKAFAERAAVNTVFQGSAADLIKRAMVDIHRDLAGQGPAAQGHMLMQIHDELVFEAPADRIGALQEQVRRRMEDALDLDVPLQVDCSVGANWLEAK